MTAAGRATQNMNSAPLKILLVEDSPSDAALLQESLIQSGLERFEFTHVECWAEAAKTCSRDISTCCCWICLCPTAPAGTRFSGRARRRPICPSWC